MPVIWRKDKDGGVKLKIGGEEFMDYCHDPYPPLVSLVPIQIGLYSAVNNSWINITTKSVTTNFIGGHYSNQYRNFNFTNWNSK